MFVRKKKKKGPNFWQKTLRDRGRRKWFTNIIPRRSAPPRIRFTDGRTKVFSDNNKSCRFHQRVDGLPSEATASSSSTTLIFNTQELLRVGRNETTAESAAAVTTPTLPSTRGRSRIFFFFFSFRSRFHSTNKRNAIFYLARFYCLYIEQSLSSEFRFLMSLFAQLNGAQAFTRDRVFLTPWLLLALTLIPNINNNHSNQTRVNII